MPATTKRAINMGPSGEDKGATAKRFDEEERTEDTDNLDDINDDGDDESVLETDAVMKVTVYEKMYCTPPIC